MELSELIEQVENVYLVWGYHLVFLSSFIETTPFGWIIPGGTMVALGGFFAYSGEISLVGIIVSGWLGMFFVFLLAYYIGRKTGPKLAKILRQEKRAARAKVLLEKHGPTMLSTSLLANLTRFWISYVAGSQKYSPVKFIFYSAAASLTWSSLLSVVGYLAGSERGTLEKMLTRLGIFSWVLLMFALVIIYWQNKKEFKETQNNLK